MRHVSFVCLLQYVTRMIYVAFFLEGGMACVHLHHGWVLAGTGDWGLG